MLCKGDIDKEILKDKAKNKLNENSPLLLLPTNLHTSFLLKCN